MDKLICQFASVCSDVCPHRWPHDRLTQLGCTELGCSRLHVRSKYGVIDEFGSDFVYTLNNIKAVFCVDFKYWKENTGHGQLIVTEGTRLKGWVENERTRMKDIAERREREMQEFRNRVATPPYNDAAARVSVSTPDAPADEEDTGSSFNFNDLT